MIRRLLLALGFVTALGVPVALVIQKEAVLSDGTTILLRLAPVDPRSLMQGDYMDLRYAVAREVGARAEAWPRDGRLVVRLDERGVARFVERWTEGRRLGPDEHLLRYRVRPGAWGDGLRLGAESFFFQEGHADRYRDARYGELKVAEDGESVLVGLRGEDLEPLGRDAGR